MRVCCIVLVLLIPVFCYGQNVSVEITKPHKKAMAYKGDDPYKGKPFKAGDMRTMHLKIPVGKITISNDITYRLIADADGKAYAPDHKYRIYITKVIPTEKDTSAIPRALTDAFLYRVTDLTEQQIMSSQITATEMDYFYKVQDFNLDGIPDFAFKGDRRYHPYPVKNYVWVNINGKLVYWHGLSDVPSDKENIRTRMLSIIVKSKSGNLFPEYYHVVKDTFLVPCKL